MSKKLWIRQFDVNLSRIRHKLNAVSDVARHISEFHQTNFIRRSLWKSGFLKSDLADMSNYLNLLGLGTIFHVKSFCRNNSNSAGDFDLGFWIGWEHAHDTFKITHGFGLSNFGFNLKMFFFRSFCEFATHSTILIGSSRFLSSFFLASSKSKVFGQASWTFFMLYDGLCNILLEYYIVDS